MSLESTLVLSAPKNAFWIAEASMGSPAGVPLVSWCQPSFQVAKVDGSKMETRLTGAMSFKVLASLERIGEIETGFGIGTSNESLLCRAAWHSNTCGTTTTFVALVSSSLDPTRHCTRSSIDSGEFHLPVLVDASVSNDGFNMVAITNGIAQLLQHYCSNTVAPRVAVGISVPHARSTAWRKHMKLALRDISH